MVSVRRLAVIIGLLLPWCAMNLTSAACADAAGDDVGELYRELRQAPIDPARAVALAGVELERADSRLVLRSGHAFPIAAGDDVIGAVFVGDGLFRFAPASAIERQQLERFTKKAVLEEPFDRLLLLFSDSTWAELSAGASGRSVATDKQGKKAFKKALQKARKYLAKRRKQQRKRLGENWSARLLRDRLEGEHGFFLAEPKTKRHGVVALRYDPRHSEQVRLKHWSKRFAGFYDTWVSYADGPPRGPEARISHYEIDVTLDGDDLTEVVVDARLEPLRGAPRVIIFDLHPLMEVFSVSTADGEELFHAREDWRDHQWERRVTVVLPEPLTAPRSLVFRLGGDIIEDHHGGQYGIKVTIGWYPRLGYYQRATHALRFDTEADFTVLASATKLDERLEGERRLTSWRLDFPVSSVAFNYGEMEAREITPEGLPPVTMFAREHGIVLGDAVREVGEQVSASLAFYTERFGPPPFEHMYVTRIPYSHGQGFPGLLHLSKATFGGGFRGVDEAFRGHEVAHQWWGHLVGWKSYRDQWLSEGFAVYSGALFAVDVLDDPKILGRMLKSWRHDILGQGNVDKSLGFGRFGLSREAMKYGDGSEAGPLSLGWRLHSSRGPVDYRVLVYEKGAWVLHMLRMLLHDFESGSDAAFEAMLRDFAASHHGRNASTADFQATVEKHTGEDMGWFFEQWVDGIVIPKYRFAWRSGRDGDDHFVRLRVEQRLEQGETFRMPVPVRVETETGEVIVERVVVDGLSDEFVIRVHAPARKLEFNCSNAVLCELKSVRY